MATVRFNKELRAYIINNAELQMRPSIDRANALVPSGSEWGMKAHAIMFQHEMPLIEQAPDNWFKHRTEIGLRGLIPTDHRELTLKLPSPVRWPEIIVENDFIEPVEYGYGSVRVKPHPAWDELVAAYKVYREAHDAAHSRRTTYVKSVEKIINTYSTLTPALKAWAPLWDLLPSWAQLDHHSVAAPRQREEKDIEVDFNHLTSISTAVKFGV